MLETKALFAGTPYPSDPHAEEATFTWRHYSFGMQCCNHNHAETRHMQPGETWIGPVETGKPLDDHGWWFCSQKCAMRIAPNFRALPATPEQPPATLPEEERTDVFYAGSLSSEPEAVEYALFWRGMPEVGSPYCVGGGHTRQMEPGERWLGPKTIEHGAWLCSIECAKSSLHNFRAIPVAPEAETPFTRMVNYKRLSVAVEDLVRNGLSKWKPTDASWVAWQKGQKPIIVESTLDACLTRAEKTGLRTLPFTITRITRRSLEQMLYGWTERGKLAPAATNGRPISRFHLPEGQRK